mgnify:CR=1 FL=1
MQDENSIKNNRHVVESTYPDVHMETVEDHTKKKKSTDETRSTKMASGGTLSNSRKGCMAIAKGGLGSLISERILKLKGLLSLTDHYQKVHSY